MIFQPFYFLNSNLFWSKSTTNSVRFLLFPDLENTAAYLLELLDLRLLKHGEDVGASLLSSPLSLIWGLLTRLGKTTTSTQRWISLERTTATTFKSVNIRHGLKKLYQKPPFTYFILCCQLERQKEGTVLPCLRDGTWTPSRGEMLGWVLFPVLSRTLL